MTVSVPGDGSSASETRTPVSAASDSLRVTGRVVDAMDPQQPVADARVRVGAIQVDVDSDGAFRIGMASEVREVTVSAPGYYSRTVSIGPDLMVDSGSPVDLGVLQLDRRWFELDAVVVTGNPMGGDARYQPAQALSTETIRRRSGLALGDLLDGEPGIAARSMGPAPSRPVVRGMDGERILILQNGERMGDLSGTAADHAVPLDPLALSRVEVVRGPAGLLYGSNALGGVVNLLDGDAPAPGRPRVETVLEGVSGTPSSAASGRAQWGEAGGAMGSLRLTRRDAGPVGTPTGPIPSTQRELTEAALGGAFRSGGFRGEAVVGMQVQDYGLPEDLDDPEVEIGIQMRREYLRGQVVRDWDRWVSQVELRMRGSRYRHDEIETFLGGGGRTPEVDVGFRQATAGGTLTVRHGALSGGRFTPIESGAFGVHATHRDLRLLGPGAFHPDGQLTSAAVFLFQESPSWAGLRFQGGGRLELDWLEVGPGAGGGGWAEERRSGSTVSGSVGLNWALGHRLEVGLQWARAHRMPTLEERYSDGAHLGAGAYEVGRPDLSPEVGTGLDVHARFGFERVRAELALFQNTIRDFVALMPTGRMDDASGLPIFEYTSTTARLRGGELSVEVRPTTGVVLRSGLDAVFGRELTGEGERLPFMPPIRGFVDAGIERSEGSIAVRVRGVASQRRVADGEHTTPGAVLTGVRMGIHLPGTGNHILQLRVDNLFDVTWRDHLSRLEKRDLPMPGRTFTLGYRWALP